MTKDYQETLHYFHEVPMDPNLMDQLFCREDNLFFQHPGMTKPISSRKKQELIRLIKKIIAEDLTQNQRETMELYFFHSKNETEIGQILNRHQTTISQHLRYGLKKIRKILKKNGYFK